jgi:hypothetical protein
LMSDAKSVCKSSNLTTDDSGVSTGLEYLSGRKPLIVQDSKYPRKLPMADTSPNRPARETIRGQLRRRPLLY